MKTSFKKHLTWMLIFTMVITMLVVIPGNKASAAVNFNTMPIPTLNTTQNGYHIARTMHLLETSTAEHPNTVRIAVTGQSISDGNNIWHTQLIDYLKQRYPTANIIFENFAIGGFASQLLYKRVPNDMSTFFPDLVILYVYGDHTKYDRIVKFIRQNIGAEVMMQTEHYTGPENWSDQMSYTLLPQIADKYGAELCRLREPWKKWLSDYNLQPSALLKDGVHLNDDGQKFMLELMKQFFVYRISNAESVLASQTKVVQPGDWVNGKLTVPFHGTRAEIIAGLGQQYSASVKVDGTTPSGIKESYITSRESKGMTGTTLGIVKFNSVPQEQTWTVEVASYTNKDTFTVKASGSNTGDEGSSVNNILNGTHLRLDNESFIWDFTPPTVGATYTFTSILNGTDTYNGSKKVLFSGIEIKDHTLVLEAANTTQIPDIKEIHFYDPSVQIIANDKLPTVAPTTPPPSPTPRAEWFDNGNFEGKYTENMFGSGLDIPDSWSFWGASSMSMARGQGVNGSAGGKINVNTGSRSNVEISKTLAGMTLNFSAKVKQLTPALDTTSGPTLKIHAESTKSITVDGQSTTQNYEVPVDKKFVITNSLFNGNTDFVAISTTLKVPTLDEIVDQNGDKFAPDFFSFQMWNNDKGGEYIIDEMSLTFVNTPPTPNLSVPSIKGSINSATTSIAGSYRTNGTTITLKSGSKVLKKATVSNGRFTLKLASQAPGTKLTIQASKTGYKNSSLKTYIVSLQKPEISSVKSGSKIVKGKAYKRSTLTVFVKGKKHGVTKASSSGNYSLTLKSKLVKGNIILVKCKSGKYASSAKYTVRK